MVDVMDSSVEDEAALYSTAPTVGVVVGATFAKLAGVFDSAVGGDGSFLITDAVAETVTTSSTAGFTYGLGCELTFTAANNAVVDFAIAVDGTVQQYIASATARGSSRPVSISLSSVILSANASSVVELYALSTDTASLDVLDGYLLTSIRPTNNP